MVVSLGSEDYTLPVKVTSTSGSLVRFRFGDLNLSQQAMLTRVIFGRADSWLKWRFSYEVDRPLVNLLRITAMSIRGIGVALYSLVPKRKPRTKETRNVREQTALPLAFLLLLLAGAPSATAQSSVAAIPAESAPMGTAIDTGNAPWFRDVRDLSSLGLKQGSMVRGARGRFTLHFGLPITKMVVESGLVLHYRVSPRVAKGSRIHVSLNGSPSGTIRSKQAEALPLLFRRTSPFRLTSSSRTTHWTLISMASVPVAAQIARLLISGCRLNRLPKYGRPARCCQCRIA